MGELLRLNRYDAPRWLRDRVDPSMLLRRGKSSPTQKRGKPIVPTACLALQRVWRHVAFPPYGWTEAGTAGAVILIDGAGTATSLGGNSTPCFSISVITGLLQGPVMR